MKFFSLNYLLLLIAITVTIINICTPSFANTQQIKPTSIAKKLAELETSFDASATRELTNQLAQTDKCEKRKQG